MPALSFEETATFLKRRSGWVGLLFHPGLINRSWYDCRIHQCLQALVSRIQGIAALRPYSPFLLAGAPHDDLRDPSFLRGRAVSCILLHLLSGAFFNLSVNFSAKQDTCSFLLLGLAPPSFFFFFFLLLDLNGHIATSLHGLRD